MDTRDTSEKLLNAAKKACKLMSIKTTNYGLVTTPKMHWLVSKGYTHFNDTGLYTQFFKDSFLTFISLSNNDRMMKNEKERENYQHGIVVDCANGVGSIVLKEILGFAGFPEKLPCTLINDSEKPDHLNDNCGAEHV